MGKRNEMRLSGALLRAYETAQRDLASIEGAWERPESRPVAERFIWRMSELAAETVRELAEIQTPAA